MLHNHAHTIVDACRDDEQAPHLEETPPQWRSGGSTFFFDTSDSTDLIHVSGRGAPNMRAAVLNITCTRARARAILHGSPAAESSFPQDLGDESSDGSRSDLDLDRASLPP